MAKQRIVPVPVATPMIGLINASEFRWHIANHPVWGTMSDADLSEEWVRSEYLYLAKA